MAKEKYKPSADLPETLEEAIQLITVLREEKAANEAIIAELNESNAELSKQVESNAKAEKSAGILSSASHDGKKYRFTVPTFYIPDGGTVRKLTHIEAAKDKDAMKFLVESKSAVLEEIK